MSRPAVSTGRTRRLGRAMGLVATALFLFSGPGLFPAPAKPKEILLLGRVEPEQILKISPEWKAMHDAASLDTATVGKIRAAENKAAAKKESLRIEVVFGSWCSDSRDQVPVFIKLEDLLGADRLPATYVGVDHSMEDPQGFAAPWKIERVPTFIVTCDGKEVGRIVESPRTSLEGDLAEILERPGKP